MASSPVKIALGNSGSTRALKCGEVPLTGVDAEFIEVTPTHEIFRRMIQQGSFDVAEMSLTTYILARACGMRLTALPVVPVRMFHHGTIWCNVDAGIQVPKDLEGKRVGMRAYAQTGPTWSRGILQHEYGVDLERITWVTYEGSHVSAVQDPPNAVRAQSNQTLAAMLERGEIDVALSLDSMLSDKVRPLFADAHDIEMQWFRNTGIYPINHLVVMRSELNDAQPELAAALFDALKLSRQRYLNELAEHGPRNAEDALLLRLQAGMGGDPLPIGFAANRPALQAMAAFAFEQRLAPVLYRAEDLFEPAMLRLA